MIRGLPAYLFLTLLAAGAGACQASRPEPPMHEDLEFINLSASEEATRIRLHDFSRRFAHVVEATADEIMMRTSDPDVRRAALELKTEAIPACQAAAFRSGHLGAVLDTWVFCVQIEQFLTEGDGSDIFGDLQPLAVAAAKKLVTEIVEVAKTIARDPDSLERYPKVVKWWADEHPISGTVPIRESMGPFLAEFAVDETGAFAAVESVDRQFRDLLRRVEIYTTQLPKQMRWQAQLLAEDTLRNDESRRALEDLRTTARAFDRIATELEKVPELVETRQQALTEAIHDERRLVLEAVGEQRIDTIEALASERQLVLEDIQKQRLETIAELKKERAETVREVEAATVRVLENMTPRLEGWIDHLVLRVVQILAVSGLVAAIATALLLRARKKRAPTT